MKGKLLSYEEIINLKEGTKVWYDGLFHKCLAIIKGNSFYNTKNNTLLYDKSDFRINDERKIYKWIEDERTITKETEQPKTYKGSEILAMIEDRKLFREDTLVIENTNTEFEVAKIVDGYYGCEVLLKNKFTIKQKPVDFMTAYNSHKKVKPEHGEYIYSDMKDYLEVIRNSSQDVADELINGKWFIQ